MASMFFYGTLCDMDMLEIVLGRSRDTIDVVDAQLADHAVYWAIGQNYPVIVPQTGSVARGIYVTDLSVRDVSRLDYYESGFVYEPQDVVITTKLGERTVSIYACTDMDYVSDHVWDFTDWQDRYGIMMRAAGAELMEHFGYKTADEIDPKYPMIEARAYSLQLAQQATDTSVEQGAGDRVIEVISKTPAYTNFFAVKDYQISHRKFNGEMSPVLERAVFVGTDASLVLPYDPVLDTVLLIEQFRMGPFGRGDQNPWLYEPIAGMVDQGETPEQTAHREAMEEAGLSLTKLIPMYNGYPSPGGSSTYYYQFLGLCDLSAFRQNTQSHGHADEGEDIRPVSVSFDWAFDFVMSGKCRVVPLTAAILWLDHYRRIGTTD
jgi:ADP-ribose pyrophosphatase